MDLRGGQARASLRHLARQAAEAGLRAADADAAVRRVLRATAGSIEAGTTRLDAPGRLVILGWGKAGVPMLRAALDVLGAAGRGADGGLLVVPDGHDEGLASLGTVAIATAAHPVPDRRSPELARRMLALAATLGPGDVALVLGSGGGSSLLACPVAPLTLEELVSVHAALLASGASVHEMNAVRRHLSEIHGGRLAVALGRARSIALLISDVPGDAPSNIGSGPTAPDLTTWHDVARVLGARVPAAPLPVRELVARGATGAIADTPRPGDIDETRHASVVILRNADAVRAAAETLRRAGFAILDPPGDDADLASLVASARSAPLRGPLALVAGGEHPVLVTGSGRGGRNQHATCLVARDLDAMPPPDREIVALSLATDGVDGSTSAAGGLVDAGTWSRARSAGLDPGARIAECDSHAILGASGDLVTTGPTGTNVMDLLLVLAGPLA